MFAAVNPAQLMLLFSNSTYLGSAFFHALAVEYNFRFGAFQMWMAAIWIICFLCGFIPFFIFFGARERDRHSNDPDALWPACTINLEWYIMAEGLCMLTQP